MYVVFGSHSPSNINLNSLSSAQGFTISGAIAYDYLGYSASTGDVNKDGYADIIIGAPGASPNLRTGAGKVYVIYGSNSSSNIDLLSLPSTRGFQIIGPTSNGNIGNSVYSSIDINNDGYVDVFINNAYVIFGNKTFSSIDLSSFSSAQGFASIGGLYTNNIGDINGDNYTDFLSGSIVIYGTKLPSSININSLSSSQGFYISGGSVYNGAGNINKDGYSDIIAGASSASPGSKASAGEVWLIYGAASGFITPTPTIQPTAQPTTKQPTRQPTWQPTSQPSSQPSIQPSKQPIDHPSDQPTRHPSVQPSAHPSRQPSEQPTGQPSVQPTTQPTRRPSEQPTIQPVIHPTGQPSDQPSDQPSIQPTRQPSLQPSLFLSTSLKKDLVAYYPFDGNANDESGNGNNGVVHSAIPSIDRFGNPNSCYNFDGSSSYIEITNGEAFNFVNDLSISVWIKPTANQVTWATFIGKSDGGGGSWNIEQFGNDLNSYRFYYWPYSAGSWSFSGIVQLLTNQWNHYLITKQNTMLDIYLNGILVSTANGSSSVIKTSGNLPLYIGAYYGYGTGYYFNGSIDDIFIYNRTLSVAEVKLLYNFDAPTSQPSTQPSEQPTSHPSIYPKYIGKSIDLATLTSSQGFAIYGGAANDYSGYSVSAAGDINHDGFADIIIGALFASPSSRMNAGESYVIYGSANPGTIDLSVALTSSQGFAIYGGVYFERSGVSVSAAGDVNKDGYDDVIIGAYTASLSSRTQAGMSYVIYGSDTNPGTIDLSVTLTNSQGFVIYGGTAYDDSGQSVSAAGDVNHDGFADIIIGAPGASPNSRSGAGESYVIYGSAVNPGTIDLSVALTSSQGFAIYGGTAADRSGLSVSAAGDVNKDGYADIIIGAPYASQDLRSGAGKSYVIYGSANNPGTIDLSVNLTSVQGFAILGGKAGDWSGYSVNAAGDVNGNGYADIIIGAYGAGESYVIYGSAVNPGTIDLSVALTNTQGFTILGGNFFVSAAGDVNKDGYADIIIGAPYTSPSSRRLAGESYVIYGSSNNPGTINLSVLTSSQGFAILGGTANDQSGYSVSTAGDVNRDGYADIIIGSAYASPSSKTYAGTSYIIYGGMDYPTSQPSSQPSEQPTRQPSAQPTRQPIDHPTTQPSRQPSEQPTSQPIDHPSVQPSSQPSSKPTKQPTDRPSDQPSTQPSDQPSGQPSTQPTEKPSSQPTSHPSDQPSEHPTMQPSHRPTGQPSAQPSMQPSGHPSGQPSDRPSSQPVDHPTWQPTEQPSSQPTDRPSGQPSERPTMQPSAQPSEKPSAQPTSQPTSQPIDHPSTPPTEKPSSQPSSHPSGQPTYMPTHADIPTHSPTYLTSGTLPSDQGISVLGVNSSFKIILPFAHVSLTNANDYEDIVIGQPTAGVNYVIYGTNAVLSQINLASPSFNGHSTTPAISYDYSGRSVSSAGDINADGYEDLIIGTPLASSCYVLFGRESGFNTLNQGFTINGNGDFTGWSVSSAGDVNHDGYADIIIGAPYAYNGVVNSGVAYVIFGKKSGFTDINLSNLNLHQGFTIFGVSTSDYMGISVSSVGDINNDGFADIAIGALRTSANNAGAVYVIFGKASSFTNIKVDSLSAAQGFTIFGAAWSYSGYSVSAAGDFNGDGFDDILIGSVPRKTTYTTQISYLVYGKAAGFTDISLTALIPSQGVMISGGGIVVTSIGDVNNDGFDDIMIGNNYNFNGNGFVIFIPTKATLAPNTLPTSIPFESASSSPTTIPSLAPNTLPSGQPSDYPTTHPSHPTIIPTFVPTNPTGQPTSMPSNPTMAPTLIPTTPSATPTIQPTDIVTIAPSMHPSDAPSTKLTDNPSLLLSFVHISNPTKAPTMLPTIKATALPTLIPSTLPTISPTNRLASGGYITVNITDGGTYYRSALKTHFILNSTQDVKITGKGGHALFIVIAHPKVHYVITNFNQSSDLISLQDFKHIHSMQDLNFTMGSIIINLVSEQKVVLSNLNLLDIAPNNFIFTPVEDQNQKTSNIGFIAGISAASVAMAALSSGLYYYITQDQPFKLAIKSSTVAPDVEDPVDLETNAPTNHPEQKASETNAVVPTAAKNPIDLERNIPLNHPAEEATRTNTAASMVIEESIDLEKNMPTNRLLQEVSNTNIVEPIVIEEPTNLEIKVPTNHPVREVLKTNAVTPPAVGEPADIPINRLSQEIQIEITKDMNVKKQNTDEFYDSDNFEVPEYSGDENELNSIAGAPADAQAGVLKITGDKAKSVKKQDTDDSYDSDNFEVPEYSSDEHELTSAVGSSADGKADQLQTAGETVDNDDSEDSSFAEESDQENEEFISEEASESESELRPALSVSGGNVRPTREPSMQPSGYQVRKPSPQPSSYPNPQPSMQPSYEPYYTQPLSQPKLEIAVNKLDSGRELMLAMSTVKLDTPLVKLKDIPIQVDPKVEAPKLESNFVDNDQQFNLNKLIYTAVNIRQLVEYSPIIKYTSKNIIYPMIENHLPESLKNITYPEILDDKVLLFTTHLAVSHAAVMLLPQEIITKGLAISTAGSASFGIRLAVSHYLFEQRQAALAQDKPMDAFEVTKYCAVTMLAYTVPSIATCAIANIMMPGYQCGELALSTKISLAGAECYSVYKASTRVAEESTTTDIVVPYIADGISLMASYASGGSMLSVVSSVVTANYLTRAAMDAVPNEIKESYIDPVLNNVNEAITSVAGNVYGCFYNTEDSI